MKNKIKELLILLAKEILKEEHMTFHIPLKYEKEMLTFLSGEGITFSYNIGKRKLKDDLMIWQ